MIGFKNSVNNSTSTNDVLAEKCGSNGAPRMKSVAVKRVSKLPVVCVLASLLAVPGISVGSESDSASDAGSDAGPDAIELLNGMAASLKTLNYRGTFVHITDENIETMRIVHARDGITEREKMVSLNGEAREVYRNDKLVTCIWPGSQSVILSKSKPRDLLPKIDNALIESPFYTFTVDGDDRVAGHDTYVVDVKPVDQYRYGYRFWVGKDNSMLFRSVLLDSDGRSIEQVMFTDIEFPESIADAEVEADAESRGGYSWFEKPDLKAVKAPAEVDMVGFSALPEGYTEVSESYRPMPMNDSPISHVILTDGMASVSVYIEYTMPDAASSPKGASRMGAMNAYSRELDSSFVTVVGEVPVATVKSIADSVTLAANP